MEKHGLFPARIHISPRRFEAWTADPEGWAERNNGGRVRAVLEPAEKAS